MTFAVPYLSALLVLLSGIRLLAQELPAEVNPSEVACSPVTDLTGEQLFFARIGHPQNFGKEDRADIWMAERNDSGEWGKATNLGALVNSPANDYPVAVLQQQSVLFFASDRNGAEFPLLYHSRSKGRLWQLAEPIVIEDHYSYDPRVAYAVSPDGQFCVLSAERDEGMGGLDLYLTPLKEEGYFHVPRPLGSHINTPYNESDPVISADGYTLYFNRTDPLGTRVWVTRRLDNTWKHWSEPELVHTGYLPEGSGRVALTDQGQQMIVLHPRTGEVEQMSIPAPHQAQKSLILQGVAASDHEPTNVQARVLDPSGKVVWGPQSVAFPFEIILPYEEERLLLEIKADQYLPQYRYTDVVFPSHSEPLDEGYAQNEFYAGKGKGPVHQDEEVERLERWIKILDEDTKEMRAELHQKSTVTKVLDKESPEMEQLREKYYTFYYQESAEEVPGNALEDMKDKYRSWLANERGLTASDSFPVPQDRLTDLKARWAQYATPAAESGPATTNIPFEQLATAARYQAIQQLSPTYISKARSALLEGTHLANFVHHLPAELRGRLTEKDWQEIEERLRSYVPQFGPSQGVVGQAAIFMANAELQTFWNELVEQYIHWLRTERDKELQKAFRKDLEKELTYQVRLEIKTMLQDQLGRLMLEKLQGKNTGTTPNSLKGAPDNIPTEKGPLLSRRLELDFIPAAIGSELSLPFTFFEADGATLHPQAYFELDQIALLMEYHPGLSIAVEAHTHTECEPSYAKALTQVRSEAVVRYLEGRGIAAYRLMAKGMGNTVPLTARTSPAGKRLNQRVTIKILEL